MNTETERPPERDWDPDEIELLGRQLAEHGFYLLGRLPSVRRNPRINRPARPTDQPPIG